MRRLAPGPTGRLKRLARRSIRSLPAFAADRLRLVGRIARPSPRPPVAAPCCDRLAPLLQIPLAAADSAAANRMRSLTPLSAETTARAVAVVRSEASSAMAATAMSPARTASRSARRTPPTETRTMSRSAENRSMASARLPMAIAAIRRRLADWRCCRCRKKAAVRMKVAAAADWSRMSAGADPTMRAVEESGAPAVDQAAWVPAVGAGAS